MEMFEMDVQNVLDERLGIQGNFFFEKKHVARWWQLKDFWNFHPELWGFMIQFDDIMFFEWVGSTSN